MICCDLCEDWYHGKCVNITKAMGQQMEDTGIEWTCPNCIKKKHEEKYGKVLFLKLNFLTYSKLTALFHFI